MPGSTTRSDPPARDERIEVFLENTSDVVVIVDARGAITYGTPSLGHNLGLPTSETLGRKLVEFLCDPDAAEAAAVFDGFAARTAATQLITDWHLRHQDGTAVAFEVLSHNLLGDPRVAGITLTMRDVSERRTLEAQLEHQGFHDALTGLPNRALFQDRAEHALARTSRLGSVVALLVLDLDDFQAINAAHGLAAGDGLLVQVATRLRSTLLDGATVSRSGGDEFTILIEDLTGVSQAEAVAARALRALDAPFVVAGETVRVGASVGLVVTGGSRDALDVTELIWCANLALSAAKERGKGQIMLFHKDLRARMLERLTRRHDLERAIDDDEFVLHFQPIVSIETGAIVSCEALVRWAHPTEGLIPPTEFVALTEETGLIVELGRWVLEQACAQLRLWADAGHTALRMSINVSARQLHEDGFVEDVRRALRRHHVQPGRLVLELTESIFALDAAAISEQLRALRNLGVKIAMDDFGTGYSSLSYLQKFQMDILKIDRSFVDALGDGDPTSGALVSAIIALAHALRLEVIAEGIERADQRDALWSMGCGLGQGFWYSRPVEPARMTALLTGTLLASPTPGRA
ncbi:MAG: EAL domain-containing protein [Cellulomonas sp.]|nr:EAL domain-containing protein [Cellulomonas sp.]